MSNRARYQQQFAQLLEDRCLNLGDEYFDVLYQVLEWLLRALETDRRVLGISGAQGTGKSTFSHLLAEMLKVQDKTALVVSLDDFYLTRAERNELGGIHPLLKTRGVPGTHDLKWCLATVENFRRQVEAQIPVFAKPEDDRSGEFAVDFSKVDVLIFEGWCWGALAQDDEALRTPVNDLESELDGDGSWRRYVNEQLYDYQALFQADLNLLLKAPDFESVFRWRWQQERGLPQGSASMSEQDVARFIQHYQRITEHLLNGDQRQFDVTIELDRDHRLRIDKFP